MTVAELKNQLSKLPADAKVVVHWEEGSFRMGADGGVFFEINQVSLHKGTPLRENERAGFTFESSGPASWAFISISPA